MDSRFTKVLGSQANRKLRNELIGRNSTCHRIITVAQTLDHLRIIKHRDPRKTWGTPLKRYFLHHGQKGG